MENNTFTYQYSSQRYREVENIRKKYLPQEINKVDLLKRMDFKVQIAGQLQGLCVGVIGILLFGIGMCFGLDVFDGADWLTFLFCGIGVATMIPAYPIYKHIAKKTKTKLTPEILRLSEELINS